MHGSQLVLAALCVTLGKLVRKGAIPVVLSSMVSSSRSDWCTDSLLHLYHSLLLQLASKGRVCSKSLTDCNCNFQQNGWYVNFRMVYSYLNLYTVLLKVQKTIFGINPSVVNDSSRDGLVIIIIKPFIKVYTLLPKCSVVF